MRPLGKEDLSGAIAIVRADFTQPIHRRGVLSLLAAYMEDPMVGFSPAAYGA